MFWLAKTNTAILCQARNAGCPPSQSNKSKPVHHHGRFEAAIYSAHECNCPQRVEPDVPYPLGRPFWYRSILVRVIC